MQASLIPITIILSVAAPLHAQPEVPAPRPVQRDSRGMDKANDQFYKLGSDSKPQDGVPQGKFTAAKVIPSKVFPGTQHTYWVYQNVRLKDALEKKADDLNYTWGIGNHGQKQGGAIFPEMMRWLWRDHPVSADPKDAAERSFLGRAK
jgi:hypothetical protein